MNSNMKVLPVLGTMPAKLQQIIETTKLVDEADAAQITDAIVFTLRLAGIVGFLADPDAPVPDDSEWGRRT